MEIHKIHSWAGCSAGTGSLAEVGEAADRKSFACERMKKVYQIATKLPNVHT
jgi:hypothetical protein